MVDQINIETFVDHTNGILCVKIKIPLGILIESDFFFGGSQEDTLSSILDLVRTQLNKNKEQDNGKK